MDTSDATSEFHDWELLHSSDSPVSVDTFGERDSEGIIRANYFSVDSGDMYLTANREVSDDNTSAKSYNLAWIDPVMEENPSPNMNTEPGEFSSDSSSDQSSGAKFNDFEGRNEMGLELKGNELVGFEEIEQITEQKVENAQISEKDPISSAIEVGSANLNDLDENSEVGMKEKEIFYAGSEVLEEEKCKNEELGNGIKGVNENGTSKYHEAAKRGVVWWKMPIEFLRYCVFRVTPVWTVSVAAAMMGFLIVSRRLYRIKKKARALQIKVTVDDKKASQVMNRAARLNEAFSMVKRVPVIRPSPPAVGVTAWPVMGLR